MNDRFAIAKQMVRLIDAHHPSEYLKKEISDFASEFLKVTEDDEYYTKNQFDADMMARVLLKLGCEEMEKYIFKELKDLGFIRKIIWARHIKKSISMLDEFEQITEKLWSEKSNLQLVSRQLWPIQKH